MGGQINVKGRENPLTGVIKIGEFNTKNFNKRFTYTNKLNQ